MKYTPIISLVASAFVISATLPMASAVAQQSCGAQRECACSGSGKWKECNRGIWQAQQDAMKNKLSTAPAQSASGNRLKGPAQHGIVAAGAGNLKNQPKR
jgi:hypothetical protein